ncbi:MAG: hypothetical protein U1E87_09985 [Alphaproteobacteria bacterium]
MFCGDDCGACGRGATIEAEERAKAGAPVRAYQLDFRSPLDRGKVSAPYTIDILVFGNLDAPGSYADASPRSRAMSDVMMGAFIAFAKTSCEIRKRRRSWWTPYSLERRETMVPDVSCRASGKRFTRGRAAFVRTGALHPAGELSDTIVMAAQLWRPSIVHHARTAQGAFGFSGAGRMAGTTTRP